VPFLCNSLRRLDYTSEILSPSVEEKVVQINVLASKAYDQSPFLIFLQISKKRLYSAINLKNLIQFSFYLPNRATDLFYLVP